MVVLVCACTRCYAGCSTVGVESAWDGVAALPPPPHQWPGALLRAVIYSVVARRCSRACPVCASVDRVPASLPTPTTAAADIMHLLKHA
jgi:hypothetical protein